jgi:hypothetical protein
VTDQGSRYRFGPLEQRGLIAGWRGGQIASVALGLVVGIGVLRANSGVLGIAVALVSVGGALAFACWPIAGRSAEQWLPTVLAWCTTVRTHLSPWSTDGHQLAQGTITSPGLRRATRPHTFGGLSIDAAGRDPEGTAGVIYDARSHTYTCVLEVSGHGFPLLGPQEQTRRVGGWASALSSFAHEGSLVHRVQWLAATNPTEEQSARAYFARRSFAQCPEPVSHSYDQLLNSMATRTRDHDVHLAVQIAAKGAERAIRAAGGGRRGAHSVLLREATALCRRLRDAELEVEGALSSDQLTRLCARTVRSPAAFPSVACTQAQRRSSPPWPTSLRAEWGLAQTDATWHAVYWIAEWPRLDVAPDFLGPLLLGPVRRTVSVVMEPLSSRRATRQVEQARIADLADAELRRRGGFLSSARRSREVELVQQREVELADGHVSVRFSGYVMVTADSRDELTEGCEQTEQAGAQAYLELRRLYGDQQRAIAYAFPLCRGLS